MEVLAHSSPRFCSACNVALQKFRQKNPAAGSSQECPAGNMSSDLQAVPSSMPVHHTEPDHVLFLFLCHHRVPHELHNAVLTLVEAKETDDDCLIHERQRQSGVFMSICNDKARVEDHASLSFKHVLAPITSWQTAEDKSRTH